MNKKDLCTRVARWALLLEEFDYIIEHRPESRMKHCDALSRNPIALIVRNEFLEKVKVAQKEDEITLKAVIEKEYANLFMEEREELRKNEITLKAVIEKEYANLFMEEREELRKIAKQQMAIVQKKEDEITLKAVIEKEYANLFMEEREELRKIAKQQMAIVQKMAISNTIIKAYMKDVVDGYYLLETEEGDYKLPVGIIDIENGTIIRIEDKFLKFQMQKRIPKMKT
ncbi:hypothetical protein QE152_g27246 [Popillia japonica]|uniref:Uncharacterized protein n=1 Tax=Popillia japonica TaxID=7064 RepID=A0AAW1JV26_POPJA